MERNLVRERYKLLRVLHTEPHYACAEAVDILDREMHTCLLNLYDGPLLRAYLPSFQKLTGQPDFQGIFLEGESLAAVFASPEGTEIDRVFFRGDRHTWQERMEYAGFLMEQVLRLNDADPSISCPALLSENVLIRTEEHRVCLRFQIVPMRDMDAHETVFLAGDQMKKILRVRWDSPVEELAFLESMDACNTPVQLYGLWTRQRERIRSAYEALDKKNRFWRTLTLLWRRLHWILQHRKR